jgi:hypothetical protein
MILSEDRNEVRVGCNNGAVIAWQSNAEKDSRQKAGSRKQGEAAGVGCVTIDDGKVRFLEIRMLIENLVFAHSGAQPAEHVPYSDPEASNAGLSPSACRARP